MSGQEKILTSDTFAESPSWLSDGRHIIYQYAYGKSGRKNLYSFQETVFGFPTTAYPINKTVYIGSFHSDRMASFTLD